MKKYQKVAKNAKKLAKAAVGGGSNLRIPPFGVWPYSFWQPFDQLLAKKSMMFLKNAKKLPKSAPNPKKDGGGLY
jgi:hypothetical protein